MRGPGDGGMTQETGGHAEDPEFVETLEGKIRVLGFQRRLHATFVERARQKREAGQLSPPEDAQVGKREGCLKFVWADGQELKSCNS